MPPKKTKKSQCSTEQDILLKDTEIGIQERVQYLREQLAIMQAKENENLMNRINSMFSTDVLDMRYVDYLVSHPTISKIEEKDEEKVEKIVARQLLEAVSENHVYQNDVDMENDRHSTLSQEGIVPVLSQSTPTQMDEDRLQLRTPLGVTVPIPKMMRLKVDSETQSMFRKPREGEEIAFSIQGSPMVLPVEDPQLEEIKMMLSEDTVQQSPETRKMTAALEAHLRKKRILAGKADVKKEPGTSV